MNRAGYRIVYGALVAGALCGTAAGVAASASDVPTGKLPRWAVPQRYDIALRADPADAQFSGKVTIDVALKKKSNFVWINGQALDVTQVSVSDAGGATHSARYEVVDKKAGVAKVVFDKPLPAQDIRLKFVYSAAYNNNLEGFYKVDYQGKPYVMTQMEAISARLAFPSFDEPDFKTPFALHLTVPTDETVVANTQSTASHASGRWKTVDFAPTQPLPSYLVAFAVGPWDIQAGPDIPATAWRAKPTRLRGIAAKDKGAELTQALSETPTIMTALEAYYGFGYPFDKLDVLAAPDFSAGAMENAGLVTFRDWYMLLTPDSPAANVRDSFEVQAHELAHQWTGDTVTMDWWNDLWLNESFATWMQQKITHQLHPEYHADLDRITGAQGAMNEDSLTSARQIRQPIDTIGDIGNAFDSITYQKGASVLGMFEAFVGDDVFQKGMQAYIHKHQFANATANDLVDAITDAAGRDDDFSAAFKSFLNQSGVPYVTTRLLPADNAKAGAPVVQISQQRYFPVGSTGNPQRRWGLPLCVRYPLAAGGSDTACRLISGATGQIKLPGAAEQPAWLMPNAGGNGYYRFALDQQTFESLGTHLDALDNGEKLAFGDAAGAGFDKGTLDAADMRQTMRWLGRSDVPAVALKPLPTIDFLWRYVADDDAQRNALREAVAEVYLPRLEQLGYQRRDDDSPDDAELRGRLASTLGVEFGVPAVRQALLTQGNAVLGSADADTGPADSKHAHALTFSAANPDLLGEALTVAVRESGQPAVDRLMAALKTNGDPDQRNAMISALAHVQDPTLLTRVRNFALSDDIKVGEMVALLSNGGRHSAAERSPQTLDSMWPWFVAHFDAIRQRTGPFSGGGLPSLAAAGACSTQAADRLQAFFEPRLDTLRGAKRSLAQTTESIRLCAALVKAQKAKGQAKPVALANNTANPGHKAVAGHSEPVNNASRE